MLKKQLPPDAPLARRTLLKGATLRVGAGPRSLARCDDADALARRTAPLL
jgi:hypothetical protein